MKNQSALVLVFLEHAGARSTRELVRTRRRRSTKARGSYRTRVRAARSDYRAEARASATRSGERSHFASLTEHWLAFIFRRGEMTEWPKVPDSKSGVSVRVPRVRI